MAPNLTFNHEFSDAETKAKYANVYFIIETYLTGKHSDYDNPFLVTPLTVTTTRQYMSNDMTKPTK